MLKQGLERIIEEAGLMARCTRKGLEALGFRLVSQHPSNAVTAAYPPEGVDAKQLMKVLGEDLKLKVAGGQGPLKGRIIRVAHLGYFDVLDVFTVLSAIELSLIKLGLAIDTGTGLQAALSEASESV
jgi:aspartate aminotransferase-like enzyme